MGSSVSKKLLSSKAPGKSKKNKKVESQGDLQSSSISEADKENVQPNYDKGRPVINQEVGSVILALSDTVVLEDEKLQPLQQTTETLQEHIPAVVLQQTTETLQEPIPAVVLQQTTETLQEPISAVVLQQTTETLQEPIPAVVLQQTTETLQEPISAVVLQQTTETLQEPIPAVVLQQTTQTLQEPIPAVVLQQTTETLQEPIPAVVLQQTTETLQEPIPAVVLQNETSSLMQLPPLLVKDTFCDTIIEELDHEEESYITIDTPEAIRALKFTSASNALSELTSQTTSLLMIMEDLTSWLEKNKQQNVAAEVEETPILKPATPDVNADLFEKVVEETLSSPQDLDLISISGSEKVMPDVKNNNRPVKIVKRSRIPCLVNYNCKSYFPEAMLKKRTQKKRQSKIPVLISKLKLCKAMDQAVAVVKRMPPSPLPRTMIPLPVPRNTSRLGKASITKSV